MTAPTAAARQERVDQLYDELSALYRLRYVPVVALCLAQTEAKRRAAHPPRPKTKRARTKCDQCDWTHEHVHLPDRSNLNVPGAT